MDKQYLDLHEEICGNSLTSKAEQTLSNIVDAVSGAVFLNVDHVVKGGSIGKGTAILGNIVDAEAVFVLRGLPATGHDRWLPPMLKAVHGVLMLSLGVDQGVDHVRVTGDSVQMRVEGLVTLDVRFAPVIESYAQVLRLLEEQGPEARKHYAASLAKERTSFVARQPDDVKVTIRLLKWWRDQQAWSDKVFRPTDAMLEVVSGYSFAFSETRDQRTAVANVMVLLSQFNELQIVWSDRYSRDNVWEPLLLERPLLMDPTNPFVNLASPQTFDAFELMSLSKTTAFFV